MNLMKNSIVSKINRFLGTKKDKVMSTTENTTEQIEQEVRKFQWKKGENFGFTVVLESEDDQMFYFTDGSRIYKNIHKEFLEEVINGEIPFPPANSIPYVEPKKEIQAQTIVQPTMVMQQPEVSPLEKLIIKLSSKNVETIDLSIGINLPKKEVFSMLLENGDETRDEMISAISQIVTSQIQIDKLQSYINQEVVNYLNNYYE